MTLHPVITVRLCAGELTGKPGINVDCLDYQWVFEEAPNHQSFLACALAYYQYAEAKKIIEDLVVLGNCSLAFQQFWDGMHGLGISASGKHFPRVIEVNPKTLGLLAPLSPLHYDYWFEWKKLHMVRGFNDKK